MGFCVFPTPRHRSTTCSIRSRLFCLLIIRPANRATKCGTRAHFRSGLPWQCTFGCGKFKVRRDLCVTNEPLFVVGRLTDLFKKIRTERKSVRARCIHRGFGATRPSVLERAAPKSDGHLALAQNVVLVMNGLPLGNITLSAYN